jgi:hypothetical protein
VLEKKLEQKKYDSLISIRNRLFCSRGLGCELFSQRCPNGGQRRLDWKVLLPLADLIADQRTSGSAANGSEGATEDGISGYTAEHCARARADLCVSRVGSAASQGNQGDGSG